MCLSTQTTMFHLETKYHMSWCVCHYQGTLKQFNDTFHTHAKNNINSLKNSQPQTPSKRKHAPPSDLLTLYTHTKARLRRDTHSKTGTRCTHYDKFERKDTKQSRSVHEDLTHVGCPCLEVSHHHYLRQDKERLHK